MATPKSDMTHDKYDNHEIIDNPNNHYVDNPWR